MNPEILSVGLYLDLISKVIGSATAKIQGEVGQCTKRGSAVYFSLQDKEEKAILNCFMWASDLRLYDVDLKEGVEMIVTGYGEIYKPTGKMSLHVTGLELVGEGALKKAYEELKKKLSLEGFFDESIKKPLPMYPKKIGVITSRDGAVIHDLLNNLDRRGFQVSLLNSRVEGVRAVPELIKAMRYFKKQDIDILVVIRGGGSMESFLAFNNEVVVRQMKTMPFPVISGLGHDKDIPLFSLASDFMTSTPTAVSAVLNSTWKDAIHSLELYESKLKGNLTKLRTNIENALDRAEETMRRGLRQEIDSIKSFLMMAESTLRHSDPKRQLKFGYSIARINGKVVRSTKDVKRKQVMITEVSDGKFESGVI